MKRFVALLLALCLLLPAVAALAQRTLVKGMEGDDVLAMLHGYASQHGQNTEYVAEKISSNESEPNLSLVGCFVAAPHCSIPTIRRAVLNYLDRIHFVLVYTPSDSLLTTIPVVNGDLVVEREFYGEQRMEILKIWIKQGR